MRVHIIGNTCNNGYDLARLLRASDVDAHLFLTPAERRHPQTLPESSDPSLTRGYPDWIHRLEIPLARFRHRGSIPRRVRDELTDCDLIHAHGNYAVWIMRASTPFVIQPFGNDFFVMPFGRPGRSFKKLEDLIPDYRWVGLPLLLREAYQRCSAIVLFNVDHLWERAYTALVPGKRIGVIGLITDTEQFAPGDTPPPVILSRLRERHELVLFQPTRQIWTPPGRRENGDYSYGNDLFLRGLAQAVQDGASACALLVDKGNTCTTASKALARELGIADRVVWIPEMPRHQLISYYRHVDLTVDAFYAGGFGSAALEAMACGCPVLMYLDEPNNRAVFGEVAPVVNAQTADDIAARIRRAATAAGRAELREMAPRARGFVERHHSGTAVVPRYKRLYETVLGRGAEFEFADPAVFLGVKSPLAPAPRLRLRPEPTRVRRA
jgi:glycosyltransferase involved in cell wall biosynthesis